MQSNTPPNKRIPACPDCRKVSAKCSLVKGEVSDSSGCVRCYNNGIDCQGSQPTEAKRERIRRRQLSHRGPESSMSTRRGLIRQPTPSFPSVAGPSSFPDRRYYEEGEQSQPFFAGGMDPRILGRPGVPDRVYGQPNQGPQVNRPSHSEFPFNHDRFNGFQQNHSPGGVPPSRPLLSLNTGLDSLPASQSMGTSPIALGSGISLQVPASTLNVLPTPSGEVLCLVFVDPAFFSPDRTVLQQRIILEPGPLAPVMHFPPATQHH